MGCRKCDAELAEGARFCSDCGAAVAHQAPVVDTGGGTYFGGSVTAGKDVVGTVYGGYTSGLEGEDLARLADLFRGVYSQIARHVASDPDADAELLRTTAKQVEQEVAKGKDADLGTVKRVLTTLARLAPDVLEVAVNAITNPGAAVASAVRIVAEQVRELTA